MLTPRFCPFMFHLKIQSKDNDMSVFKRGPHWWFRFMYKGERHYHPCGRNITTRAAAKRIEKMAREAETAGEFGPARKPPKLCDFAAQFLEFVDEATENKKLQPHTNRWYRNGVRLLKPTRLWKMPINRITSEDVDRTAFRDQHGHKPLGPSSCNNAIRTLHRILSMAERRGLLGKVQRFHLYEENQREQIIDEWLESLLLKHARYPLFDAIILGIDGAMRAAEICTMRWENVHLDMRPPRIFIAKSKSKKGRRWVGITSRMQEVLEARKGNGSEWVFPSRGGKSSQTASCGHTLPSSLDRMWRKMKARVIEEIQTNNLPPWPEGLVFHSCRHTGATRYSNAVGNPFKVADFVGHADTRTTRRYVHHDDDTAAAMERYKEGRLPLAVGDTAPTQPDNVLEDLRKMRDEELIKLAELASDGAAAQTILRRFHSLDAVISGRTKSLPDG